MRRRPAAAPSCFWRKSDGAGRQRSGRLQSAVVTVHRNAITGEPVLFAPQRAERPGAFGAEDRPRCPFCPGHEADTPPTIAAIGEPWRVRVFANKYPAAEGAEVIVESPEHGATFDRIAHAEEAVRMYMSRYRAHAGAAYTAIFRNEGAGAGSSIPHLHSQVVPLPFVPPRIERESAAFARAAACPLCEPAGPVIAETASLTWLAPAASALPYQQWIVPKAHVSDMTVLDPGELAGLLQSAAAAMRTLADSWNWMFMNFPHERAAHCYIELFPRLTTIAGLELGTGAFVNIVDPEDAAGRLRR
jgi:UDPglucose--hexose-1-phosphate uridylyltransferase